nr:MAG TPA: hypothetical protein [Caudoviricetes sp.]
MQQIVLKRKYKPYTSNIKWGGQHTPFFLFA